MSQITVITDDRIGLIAEISQQLAEAEVNIAGVEARQVAAKACVRLSVDKQDAALACLQSAGIQAIAEDVILLRMQDQPGALAHISRQLAEAGIDIRTLSMVHRDEGENIVALACSDGQRARQLLDDRILF
jgi:hypothetical protein